MYIVTVFYNETFSGIKLDLMLYLMLYFDYNLGRVLMVIFLKAKLVII